MTQMSPENESPLLAEMPADHPGVCIVRLNRPRSLNALNGELVNRLVDRLHELDADDTVRVVILTGQGRGFAAGADIAEMVGKGPVAVLEAPVIARWDEIRRFAKPLIAAVHGFALGGGLELAMACDIIVAAEGTRLGQPEIRLGLMPGAGGTQRLTRAVGKARAMELILTGQPIAAEEAQQWGLVNRVVPAEQLLPTALALADAIAAGPAVAMRLAKESVLTAYETGLAQGLLYERRLFAALFATEDAQEGVQAFVQKRPPQFKGR